MLVALLQHSTHKHICYASLYLTPGEKKKHAAERFGFANLFISSLFVFIRKKKIVQMHGGKKEVMLLMIFSPYCVHHRVLETGCFTVLEEVRHQAQPTYKAYKAHFLFSSVHSLLKVNCRYIPLLLSFLSTAIAVVAPRKWCNCEVSVNEILSSMKYNFTGRLKNFSSLWLMCYSTYKYIKGNNNKIHTYTLTTATTSGWTIKLLICTSKIAWQMFHCTIYPCR